MTLKYDAISDGVSYGVEEEGMEKKKKYRNIFHIWEHVKVIKVTQKKRDGNIAHRSASRIRNKLHFWCVYDRGKKNKLLIAILYNGSC